MPQHQDIPTPQLLDQRKDMNVVEITAYHFQGEQQSSQLETPLRGWTSMPVS